MWLAIKRFFSKFFGFNSKRLKGRESHGSTTISSFHLPEIKPRLKLTHFAPKPKPYILNCSSSKITLEKKDLAVRCSNCDYKITVPKSYYRCNGENICTPCYSNGYTGTLKNKSDLLNKEVVVKYSSNNPSKKLRVICLKCGIIIPDTSSVNDMYFKENNKAIKTYLPSSVCDNCNTVVGIPQQSTPQIKSILQKGNVKIMLTENFSISEFSCNDENKSPVPPLFLDNVKELAKNLQVLRDVLGTSIHVNSGYRTPAYNTKVGGVKKSQHMLCKAADITVKGMSPKEIYIIVIGLIKSGKMKAGGVGIYRGFVHYDTRGVNRRWKGTGVKWPKV